MCANWNGEYNVGLLLRELGDSRTYDDTTGEFEGFGGWHPFEDVLAVLHSCVDFSRYMPEIDQSTIIGRRTRKKPGTATTSEAQRCESTSWPEQTASASAAVAQPRSRGETASLTWSPTILGGYPMADRITPDGSGPSVPTATERFTTEQTENEKNRRLQQDLLVLEAT